MLPIGELMRREIAVVPPHAPVRRVIEVMVDTGVEGVLVVDRRGRVVGSIGDEQLVAGLHAGRNQPWWRQLVADGGVSWVDERLFTLAAAEVMLRRVVAVDPTMSATSALRLFDEHAVNVLPVVDHGLLVGAVFRRDLVERLLLPHPFSRPAET
jgi:CBS-domain-containing membrane protein